MRIELSPANAGKHMDGRGLIGLPHSIDIDLSGYGRGASIEAENRELRAEVERLRVERDRLQETQRRLMDLLNVHSPERLVHDVRNVLNERELFRTLVDAEK